MKQKITVKFSELRVPEHFTKPKEEKFESYKKNFNKTGELRPIKVNSELEIQDGYISYLIMKERVINPDYPIEVIQFIKKAEQKESERDLYIFGKHPHSNDSKEYVWRVGKRLLEFRSIQEGDYFTASTKFGSALVRATRIEILDKKPYDGEVLRVNKYIGKELNHEIIRVNEEI